LKALVTGATGFVGGELSRSLVAAGREVRALLRATSDARSLEGLGVEIARGDLGEPTGLADAARGCDHVYHLAAMMHESARTRDDYVAANVTGTEALVRSAAAAGAKHFVYTSSTGIHGFIRETPLTEDSRVRLNSYYHETKYRGERVALHTGAEIGLPVTVARLPSVIGVGKKGWEPFLRALARPGFRCVGSGENHVHMGTAHDIAHGLRLCAERRGSEGRVYLLAGPAPLTVNRMIEIMAEEIGAPTSVPHLPGWPYWLLCRLGERVYQATKHPVDFIQRYSLNLCDKIIDTSRARNELGFEPQDDVEQALRETVRWYRGTKRI